MPDALAVQMNGLRVVVVLVDVLANSGDQFLNIVEYAAAKPLLREG